MFNNILNTSSDNELEKMGFDSIDDDTCEKYKQLRTQYEADNSCEDELYELCKEISMDESAEEYLAYMEKNDEYNDLASDVIDLRDDSDDSPEALKEYQEALEKLEALETELLPAYEKFLKKKYEVRDKLFPEMAERSKEFYQLDLIEFENQRENSDNDFDDED